MGWVDPHALAETFNRWLALHQDKLPKSLALDGKDLGHSLGAIVTLCRHEDGRLVAMESYSGAKDDCELPVAQERLARRDPLRKVRLPQRSFDHYRDNRSKSLKPKKIAPPIPE
jgi:hypothetical protein